MNLSFNTFGYSRERRQFGRQCVFSDRNELLFSFPQRGDLRRGYILRNPVDRGTQKSVQKGMSQALTENVTLTSHGVTHLEGGWPKDVNILDEEQTQRHRKKIEREDNWGIQVIELSKYAINVALQNSAVNIYEEFFEDLEGADIRDTFTARPMNIYHDPLAPPIRPIAQIDWCPGQLGHILSVHSNFDYYPTNDGPNDIFIWDIENPLKTFLNFTGPTWITKACYCPKDETLIAGGFKNGKVAIWDSRVGGMPVETCPLEAAHREAVSSFCWTHSKTNTEFYSGSLDGTIFYWDGRNLKTYFQSYLLDPVKTDEQVRSRSHGCTVLEFEYTIPVRYIVGDDMGLLHLGNRKGMTPSETLVQNFKLFSGPIHTVERNPFFVKNFLIVGDWMAKIWSEEMKDFPTTFYVTKDVQLMCGTWSTSRCSVFVTGDYNGVVDFWDLLLNQKKPIHSINFKSTVTAVKFRRDGEFLAVSLQNGDIQMLELDEALRYSGLKEKGLLGSLFERETSRSKLLQDRVEEIKLREMLAAAGKKVDVEDVMGEGEEVEEEPKKEEDEFEAEEEELFDPDPEYTEVRNNFLNSITALQEKAKERQFINEPSPFEGYSGYEYRSYSVSIASTHSDPDAPKDEFPS